MKSFFAGCLPIMLGLAVLSAACAPAAGGGPAAAPCPSFDSQADTAATRLAVSQLRGKESQPVLANRGEVARLMKELHPPALRAAGIDGVVQVSFVVTLRGRSENPRVTRSSGRVELDAATIALVRRMVFTPAKSGPCQVPVLVTLPVEWVAEAARPG